MILVYYSYCESAVSAFSAFLFSRLHVVVCELSCNDTDEQRKLFFKNCKFNRQAHTRRGCLNLSPLHAHFYIVNSSHSMCLSSPLCKSICSILQVCKCIDLCECVWSVITGSLPSMLTQTCPSHWSFKINKQTSDMGHTAHEQQSSP